MITRIMLLMLFLSAFAFANPVGGKQHGWGVINPGETQEYKVLVDKNTTVFTINGDGNGDINCYAIDENNKELNRDISGYDGCRLTVYPANITMIRFVITNNGSEASRFNTRIY
jgi:hypothetical protein